MHPRLLLVALQLLTRLPVGDPWRAQADQAAGAAWFGVVGALVGGVAAFAHWTVGLAFPTTVAAVVAVLVVIVLTGALHEDGLADTADGLFGGGNPDRRLAIMRDSRTGAYGVVAVVVVLLLRVLLLADLPAAEGAAALVAAATTSRGLLGLLVLGTVPAADDGSGAAVLDHLAWPAAAAGVVSVLVVDGVVLGLLAPAAVAAALGTALAVRVIAVRRLGGLTGDVMGAMVLCADVAVLAVVTGVRGMSAG